MHPATVRGHWFLHYPILAWWSVPDIRHLCPSLLFIVNRCHRPHCEYRDTGKARCVDVNSVCVVGYQGANAVNDNRIN